MLTGGAAQVRAIAQHNHNEAPELRRSRTLLQRSNLLGTLFLVILSLAVGGDGSGGFHSLHLGSSQGCQASRGLEGLADGKEHVPERAHHQPSVASEWCWNVTGATCISPPEFQSIRQLRCLMLTKIPQWVVMGY